MAIDAAGNIYTTNYASASKVTKTTHAGVSSTFGATGIKPYGIAINSLTGCIYAANFGNNTVSSTRLVGLPLTLISFTAVKQGNAALLNWTTVSEQNTKDFIIERSTNVNDYTQIGMLAASTNSSIGDNHNFTDNNLASGETNYYRLKMEDINGDFTYSFIEIVNFNESNAILVYPNPATDNITITGLQAGMQLRIIGVDGRIVTTKITTGNTGNINVQQLATGMYTIQAVKDGAAVNAVKFSKN
jgi:trimeric autotransporter adhesin